MIRLRVTTKRRTGIASGRLMSARRGALARAVAEGAEELRDAARDMIGKPGSDRPSRPGEPPRTQTGQLRDSIDVRLRDGGLRAQVGTDLEYGRHLEFGTRRTAARPWLQPAFEMTKARIKARIRAALGGAR